MYIRYDPNEPGDRERAYGQFLLGFIVLWGTVGSVIYYLCSIIPFIEGSWSENVLYSIGLYTFMGILDFSVLNAGNSQKRKVAGKFFTIFFGGMLDATAMVATVYKGNIIKNLIMDCQSYTKYRPNETTGGIFVSWRRKEELPTGA